MDIHGMVKVEGRVVAVKDDDAWYHLDPAGSPSGAMADAAVIRRLIGYAVRQHAATEATPGEFTVTFPFKPGQRVRVKTSGEVLTVTGLRVDEPGNITIRTCNPNGRVDVYQDKYTSWHNVSDLEAIPKTALEVLEELRERTKTCSCSVFVLGQITELEKELRE